MKPFLWLGLLLVGLQTSYATHLRGGYIRTQTTSANALAQQVTLILFMDEVTGRPAADVSDVQEICFGDGTSAMVTRTGRQYLSNRTISINSYQITHTYAGPGTYTLSSSALRRTPIENIPSADQLLFSVSTIVSIGNLVNVTPSPEFSRDTLTVNQRATIQLRASDADGDSLTYSLALPIAQPNQNTCSSVIPTISSYKFPNDLTRQGTFKLNPVTGSLIWDAPTRQGAYSVALFVDEYRQGILISRTLGEIILLVVDRPGTPTPLPAYEPAVIGNSLVTALPEFHDEDVSLSVFPNPVDDRLQVVIQSTRSLQATIQLINVSGRTIHQLDFGKASRQHEQVISMGDLSAGTYLLRATVGQRTLTQKIVKR
jgi:hypothetical protein